MERFQDENKWLGNFNDEVIVKCPKCDSRASIIAKLKEDCTCGSCKLMHFECKNCFSTPQPEIKKFIAYGNPYCNSCFEKYEFESQPLKEKPEKYKARCPHCNAQEEWKPKIKEVLMTVKINDGLIRDRWYNLPLWFQKEFDGSIFWAYNLDHIDYLERYIGASLRERNAKGSYSSTLVARLPQFVKAAKNREKLLKILKKWKE